MFKKIVLSTALVSAMFAAGGFTGSSTQNATNQGGFVGKGAMSASTVKQALALPDDARVVLEGKIVSEFRPEHYQFVDKNGDAIEVEIDHKDWRGVTVDENTPVRIYGEVDKDFMKTSIDVKTIEIIK
ncbi:NirD/YgiW/YdeI family stress tolerance protein [uncultured Campylobacter sp.]|mgnify:FL=1|uniref:YgiW/YdeI family stress tolerance OB fold protein n=1 Tax=uncultured Campylobacter sp. TaxID=218934 RepID=UPI002602D4E7|nr:NirD/YgiW/YdeI family stress tolerance protein [uncultured Campylobacter sp.]